MKLEVGKTYLNKSGYKVRIVEYLTQESEGFPFVCSNGHTYTGAGWYTSSGGGGPMSLVEEYIEPKEEMNLEEMKKEREELDKKIEALEKPKGIGFKPEMGGKYCYISSFGDILERVWDDCASDHERLAIGNCYPTEEAAQRIVDNRKTLVKLREFAFVPDWEDDEQDKFTWHIVNGELRTNSWSAYNYGSPVYFATEELREQAREAVGDAAIVQLFDYGVL